jgi:hypothetical protein
MFRISGEKQERIIDVETLGQIEPTVRLLPTGRYHVHRLAVSRKGQVPSAHRWATALKHVDGSVVVERITR